jgi:hypothetical protein
LHWLRAPANADLYNELLSLRPVLLDALLDAYNQPQQGDGGDSAMSSQQQQGKRRRNRVPREQFKRILDSLHVTFSDRPSKEKQQQQHGGIRRGRKKPYHY